jgi:hypothetical protein
MKQSKTPTAFQPAIVVDFNSFLNYCQKAKPSISKTKEFIGRKFVFEINQLLTHPHEGLTNRNDQNHYAQIHLFYHLALNSDLFFLDWTRKSKPSFAPNTELIERYKTLNTTEQYLFLFQSFYVYSNLELISQEDRRTLSGIFFEKGLEEFSKLEANLAYGVSWNSTANEKLATEALGVTHNSSLLLYGQYFDLWNVTKPNGKNNYSTRTFFFPDTIALTDFGKELITFLVKNAPFTLWNAPFKKIDGEPSPLGVLFDEKIYDYLEKEKDVKPLVEKMKAQYKPFFTVMKPFFGTSVRPDFEVKLPKKIIKGNFTLEVEMEYTDPKVTRTIELSNHLTLEDLHLAIINSIDFDNDHLYAFYMDKSRRNGYGAFSHYGEPPFASDFKLSDFNLYISKKFYYLFDFGDSWRFIITVKAFEKTDKLLDKPKLINQKGESPKQYPSWEDEDEW